MPVFWSLLLITLVFYLKRGDVALDVVILLDPGHTILLHPTVIQNQESGETCQAKEGPTTNKTWVN